MYTIRVHGRFFDRVYRNVVRHETRVKVSDHGDVYLIRPRLVLSFSDGRKSIISRIDERDWCIDSDYERSLTAQGEANDGNQDSAG